MRITPFVCSMSGVQNDIYKAIERLVGQADAKQWPLAGIELGRIEELSNRLAELCRLAKDALWEEHARDMDLREIQARENS